MRTIVAIISKVTGVAVAVAVVGIIGLVVVAPRVLGGASLTVLSGSMSPTIPAGSLILVEPVPPSDIEPGDVITWQVRPGEATFITHRVVRVERDGEDLSFVTQGDANDSPDVEPVVAEAVRGRVAFHVPHLGRAGQQVRELNLLLVLGVVAGAMFVRLQVRDVLRRRRGDMLPARPAPVRGLLLAMIPATASLRRDIIQLVEVWNGSVLDVTRGGLTIAVHAEPARLDRIESVLGHYYTRAVARTSVSLDPAPSTGGPDAEADQTDEAMPADSISCGLLLASLGAEAEHREVAVRLVTLLDASIIEVTATSTVVAIAGDEARLDDAEVVLRELAVDQIVRSEILTVDSDDPGPPADGPFSPVLRLADVDEPRVLTHEGAGHALA